MLWFWFVIGFIMGVFGIFMKASQEYYLTIKGIDFDMEILGEALMIIGFLLAGITLLGNGIVWLNSLV